MHAAFRVAHTHRTEGVAVVARAPCQEPCALRMSRAARILQRHLERDLHAHRAGIRVEDLREVPARERHEVLRQPCRGLVREPSKHDVAHPVNLAFRRRNEPRMRMPVGRGPPRAHSVDEPPPIHEFQVHTFGARDGQGRRTRRGVGVPNMLSIHVKDRLNTVQVFHKNRSTTRPNGAY